MIHGVGFDLRRADWIYMTNTFVFAMAIGYRFSESTDGITNGQFTGIGADMCSNASVQVDSVKHWGILIENGEFTSFIHP